MSGEFNKEQLDKFAELSFSLAKITFAFVVLPSNFREPINALLSAGLGLAFTSLALLLLKMKEKARDTT